MELYGYSFFIYYNRGFGVKGAEAASFSGLLGALKKILKNFFYLVVSFP